MNGNGTKTLISASRPSNGGFLAAATVASSAHYLLALNEMITSKSPETGIALVALPIVLPVEIFLVFLLGLLPYRILSRLTPPTEPARAVFVVLVLVPLVLCFCFLVLVFLDGFTDYSPYFPSPKPNFILRVGAAIADLWPVFLTTVILAGISCWIVDFLRSVRSRS